MRQGVLSAGGGVLAGHVEMADSPLERMRGLLGRSSLPPGHAMAFDRCSLLHTCFMRFSIDVLFLDREGRVVKLCRNIRPFRLVWGGWRAHMAIEAAAGGTFPAEGVQPGVRVALKVCAPGRG